MCLCRPWCRANRAALLLIDQTAARRRIGDIAELGWVAGWLLLLDRLAGLRLAGGSGVRPDAR
jgi:hypothetical protein